MDRGKRPFDVIGQLAVLRRYARSLVRNGVDAEDLVQDALVRAYEKRASFRGGANIRNWLISILHNTHVDRLRAARARRSDAMDVLDEQSAVLPAAQEEAVHLSDIRRAFLALPEEQRAALHLVAVEELSYQEAAEALQIPVGTLMSRISRARARLRALGEEIPGEGTVAGDAGTPRLGVVRDADE